MDWMDVKAFPSLKKFKANTDELFVAMLLPPESCQWVAVKIAKKTDHRATILVTPIGIEP